MPDDTVVSTYAREDWHPNYGLDACQHPVAENLDKSVSPLIEEALGFDQMQFGVDLDQSFWLVGEELYQSIQNETFQGVPPFLNIVSPEQAEQNRAFIPDTASPGTLRVERCRIVRKRWHTRPDMDAISQARPLRLENRKQVDEDYRTGLSSRLQPNPEDGVLPSARFLVRPMSNELPYLLFYKSNIGLESLH